MRHKKVSRFRDACEIKKQPGRPVVFFFAVYDCPEQGRGSTVLPGSVVLQEAVFFSMDLVAQDLVQDDIFRCPEEVALYLGDGL